MDGKNSNAKRTSRVAALFLCFGSRGSATEDFVRQHARRAALPAECQENPAKSQTIGFHRGWIVSCSGRPHIRAAGFTKTIVTEDSFRNALQSLIDHTLLPPAAK
ncbi:hypothetical protein [Bradyrhizobium erythrophlei]|uniref:hypothetical protein n=1 Tax=Bradyrhizobium erythrophlei TaxID=1437360 RepID=UPI0009A900B1|nr:hypothetical protein [Bradyrhizobium erythrophlei]